ncbi:hypothetical protein [Psychromicrobium lacuslunae]|uniref:hypothetical protein n=1 Tax=Psychromicrobium lacuslunae TaxID=1618207 RepID=UPI000ACDBB91|nr:hypothetical protein [Psychromicrobium lacuslunae]
MTDSNNDGTIVNPGAVYDPELDYDQVGDVADEANDLRFNEEEVLIREQAQAEDEPTEG